MRRCRRGDARGFGNDARETEFSRPFGTHALPDTIPTLKGWAILVASLRDERTGGGDGAGRAGRSAHANNGMYANLKRLGRFQECLRNSGCGAVGPEMRERSGTMPVGLSSAVPCGAVISLN